MTNRIIPFIVGILIYKPPFVTGILAGIPKSYSLTHISFHVLINSTFAIRNTPGNDHISHLWKRNHFLPSYFERGHEIKLVPGG